jgi:ABC-type uncharacterized transport system ATPase subunit
MIGVCGAGKTTTVTVLETVEQPFKSVDVTK